MAVSWQTVRAGSVPTGAAERTDGTSEADGPGEADGARRWREGTEAWPAIPRAFADGADSDDGDARRALLRDLVLRALI